MKKTVLFSAVFALFSMATYSLHALTDETINNKNKQDLRGNSIYPQMVQDIKSNPHSVINQEQYSGLYEKKLGKTAPASLKNRQPASLEIDKEIRKNDVRLHRGLQRW